MSSFVKLFSIVLGWLFVLSPTWLFIGVKYALAPEGFWQRLVVYGLGLYILGGIQILFLIAGVAATVAILRF